MIAALVKNVKSLFVGKQCTPRLKFPTGTEIVCPECQLLIATAKVDIYSGDMVKSSAWDWPGDVRPGSFRCPVDGTVYFKRADDGIALLHTDKGWTG